MDVFDHLSLVSALAHNKVLWGGVVVNAWPQFGIHVAIGGWIVWICLDYA